MGWVKWSREESPFCPECGEFLSNDFLKDRRTGEIIIVNYCDGAGEDRFVFQISTGLTDKDLGDLKEVGKSIQRKMEIKLIERKRDYLEDSEEFVGDDDWENHKKPTTGKRASREEWIRYLILIEAFPVWNDKLRPYPVFFRRVEKQEGDHLEGFGKKTRARVAEILGIKTKKDCERVRKEITEVP